MFVEHKEKILKKHPKKGQTRTVTRFAFLPTEGHCNKSNKRGVLFLENYVEKQYFSSLGTWTSASVKFRKSTYKS